MNDTIRIVLILLLISIHSFLMNGFSHVNRFLTVGLYVNPISAKIDPSLFRQSLHVQSVKEKKSRLSLMHDLSHHIFRHVDLEKFSITQWLICLFFTTALLFYLGKTLIGTDVAGYGTALLFTAKLNNWTLGSPAIYINFFHHGLQWALMLNILSLTLIFRKKYPLAFLFMGIAWNFHPMSVVFLLTLFFSYWVFYRRECGFNTLLVCSLAFAIPALPILIKSFDYVAMDWEYGPEWLMGVKWNAWYTVFPSMWPFEFLFRSGLYCWLFLMGLYTLPAPKIKKDILLFVGTVCVLCLLGTIFVEVFPVPFVMKLSLWRSSWLYIILSLPPIVHLFITLWDRTLLKRFLILATLILLTGYIHSFPFYYLLLFNLCFLLFLAQPPLEKRYPWLYKNFSSIFLTFFIAFFFYQGIFDKGITVTGIGLGGIYLFLLLLTVLEKPLPRLNNARSFTLIALMFIFVFDGGILSYNRGPAIYYKGTVRGERDQWADVQSFAKKHSAKDALFIVPPYINDFGIYSDRATLGDWAEGASILYMDNDYAKKWFERMNDLGWKTMWSAETGYNALSTEEIRAVTVKYNASYVVTEKPKRFALPVVYENDSFILYTVPEVKQH